MIPSLFVHFTRRDFSGPILPLAHLSADRLSWSAFGGPHQALLSASGDLNALLELASLLRCGVMLRDHQNTPVWWGFVQEVVIFLPEMQIKLSLEHLFNQVTVQYSFLSPDNKLADQYQTSSASHPQSQREFGIKETILHRTCLDESFAEYLRDTFLALHAFPSSELSQRSDHGDVFAQLLCSGWFKSLAWRHYANPEGFYANYGPGPGVFAFGDSTSHRFVGQSFIPSAAVSLKHAFFKLRKQGAPSSSLNARLYSQSGYYPDTLLATSSTVSGADIPGTKYAWFKFTFSTPYLLSSGEPYWIVLNPLALDPDNYFYVKTDENMCFSQTLRFARYLDQTLSAWITLPSETDPGSNPDLIFRLVCVSDTGAQLAAIAAAGGQFFQKITSLTSGVQTSPYRNQSDDCLKEIQSLMNLGTANKRLILSTVSPQRFLKFYEQPDPNDADIFIDAHARFYTKAHVPLPTYLPPVGRFARLASTTRFSLPWDRNRLPACFIERADYYPRTGRVVVRSM